jgi:hypothetical protein
VIVCYVDLGGIDDHHCLEVIVCCHQFHQDQQNKQSPINSDGHQFHQDQQNRQSSLNSDGHQFHQDQQNKESPLNSDGHQLLMTITV